MDETELVIVARAGETAGLVEYIYCEQLRTRAARLVQTFRDTCGVHLDVDDVQQTGIEYVLRALKRAEVLGRANPIGSLLRGAWLAMQDYCSEQRCSIRVPARSQRKYVERGQGRRVPTVASLDAPLVVGEDVTLLDLLAGEVRA
jgi:hypothetical protein